MFVFVVRIFTFFLFPLKIKACTLADRWWAHHLHKAIAYLTRYVLPWLTLHPPNPIDEIHSGPFGTRAVTCMWWLDWIKSLILTGLCIFVSNLCCSHNHTHLFPASPFTISFQTSPSQIFLFQFLNISFLIYIILYYIFSNFYYIIKKKKNY